MTPGCRRATARYRRSRPAGGSADRFGDRRAKTMTRCRLVGHGSRIGEGPRARCRNAHVTARRAPNALEQHHRLTRETPVAQIQRLRHQGPPAKKQQVVVHDDGLQSPSVKRVLVRSPRFERYRPRTLGSGMTVSEHKILAVRQHRWKPVDHECLGRTGRRENRFRRRHWSGAATPPARGRGSSNGSVREPRAAPGVARGVALDLGHATLEAHDLHFAL